MDANAAPVTAPAKGTASVKLIGMAEKAAAAEPEALEPRKEARHGVRLTCRCHRRKRTRAGLGRRRKKPRTRPCTGVGSRHRCHHRNGAVSGRMRAKAGAPRDAASGRAGYTGGHADRLETRFLSTLKKAHLGQWNGSLEGDRIST